MDHHLNERIAQRIKAERKQRGWSLDELAARSQVSRAMISKIERNVSNPTAALLARLADAMALTLTALMTPHQPLKHHITRVDEQPVWTDPESGYTRRIVSPALNEGDVEIVAIDLPAEAQVRFAAASTIALDGQIVLFEGSLRVTLEGRVITLEPGDCLRIALHQDHELANPGSTVAKYLVVTRRFSPSQPGPSGV